MVHSYSRKYTITLELEMVHSYSRKYTITLELEMVHSYSRKYTITLELEMVHCLFKEVQYYTGARNGALLFKKVHYYTRARNGALLFKEVQYYTGARNGAFPIQGTISRKHHTNLPWTQPYFCGFLSKWYFLLLDIDGVLQHERSLTWLNIHTTTTILFLGRSGDLVGTPVTPVAVIYVSFGLLCRKLQNVLETCTCIYYISDW